MMVVVMMMMPAAMRQDHDDRRPPSHVVVVVMMMVVVELGELNVVLRRLRRGLFIDRLQQRLGVRDRLQQIGE